MHEKKAKVLSLVPSWTETLLEAGVNVIGRSRFCIHPVEKVKSIPAVGGTKNLKLEEILALQPEYVVLDREENTREMAEALSANGIHLLVSHVQDLSSAADFLAEAGETLCNPELKAYAERYRALGAALFSREQFITEVVLAKNAELEWDRIEYVIWKNPYMVIGQNTFIADVLSRFGVSLLRLEKYPKIGETELRAAYNFFSSEPYPFAKDFSLLTEQGFRGALVDGEKISWYGIRNLRFLESCRL